MFATMPTFDLCTSEVVGRQEDAQHLSRVLVALDALQPLQQEALRLCLLQREGRGLGGGGGGEQVRRISLGQAPHAQQLLPAGRILPLAALRASEQRGQNIRLHSIDQSTITKCARVYQLKQRRAEMQ